MTSCEDIMVDGVSASQGSSPYGALSSPATGMQAHNQALRLALGNLIDRSAGATASSSSASTLLSNAGRTSKTAFRKQAARMRLSAINSQLQALAMSGGDPKERAKRISALLKELSQVAKDYAAAGGEDSAGSAPVGAEAGLSPEGQSTENQPSDSQSPDGQSPDGQAEQGANAQAQTASGAGAAADGASPEAPADRGAANGAAPSAGAASTASQSSSANGLTSDDQAALDRENDRIFAEHVTAIAAIGEGALKKAEEDIAKARKTGDENLAQGDKAYGEAATAAALITQTANAGDAAAAAYGAGGVSSTETAPQISVNV
jgi:hypothetical protein